MADGFFLTVGGKLLQLASFLRGEKNRIDDEFAALSKAFRKAVLTVRSYLSDLEDGEQRDRTKELDVSQQWGGVSALAKPQDDEFCDAAMQFAMYWSAPPTSPNLDLPRLKKLVDQLYNWGTVKGIRERSGSSKAGKKKDKDDATGTRRSPGRTLKSKKPTRTLSGRKLAKKKTAKKKAKRKVAKKKAAKKKPTKRRTLKRKAARRKPSAKRKVSKKRR